MGGAPPIQKAPNVGLTFPVFTPPAASSYGTTNPMAVPWTPPDLAGALNKGIETGAHLATDAIANKKSLQAISAEEQAAKQAIIAQSQPGAAQRTTVEMGPGGYTTRVISPAELQLNQAQIARERAAIEAEKARTAEVYGQTPEAQSKIAELQAKIEQIQKETQYKYKSPFEQGTGTGSGSASENVNPNPSEENAGVRRDGTWFPH